MGFNTAVLILNDSLGSMEQNPQGFVENLSNAIGKFYYEKESVDFAIGNHVNGGSVFHVDHADFTGVYAIGGNYTSKLLVKYGISHHKDEDKLELLKLLADNMGYRIVKKRAKS
jgi:hypothetical protein